jgi:amino acid transporter
MGSTPWLMIAIAILIIILGIFAVVAARKGKQRPPDYYAFFWMGLIWTIFGIPFWRDGNFAFLAMGIIFLIIGLANRDKWKKNRVRWSDLTKGERKFKMGIMIFLGLLVLLGMAVFYLAETKKLGM